MTDKEIIKALERCLSGKEELCKECPLNEKCYGDIDYLLEFALDLINRQKAEIERLRGSTIVNNIMESQKIKREAKFEAIKEFAEKLKLHSYIMSDESQTGIINRYSVVTVNQIDNILKELGGNER